jgi:hypothetical protein
MLLIAVTGSSPKASIRMLNDGTVDCLACADSLAA